MRSAQDDETKYRYALFYNVIFVSTGIADLPAAARRRVGRGRPAHLKPSPSGEGGTSVSASDPSDE